MADKSKDSRMGEIMKYLLVILLSYTFIPAGYGLEIEVRRVSDNVLVSGDAGASVTVQSLRAKEMDAKGIDILGPQYVVSYPDNIGKKVARKQRRDNFVLSHPNKDAILLKVMKRYMQMNDVDPGAL